MKHHPSSNPLLSALLGCALLAGSASAQAPDPRQEEIAKVANSFVDAFHKGDAKAIAALWTPEADYVDDSGQVTQGREAIEKSFADLFAAQKDLKVRIDVASLRFPAENIAIEDGTNTVIAPDGSAPSHARYTNVMVKQDGKWLLSNVRESAIIDSAPSANLQPIDWVIGDWTEKGDKLPLARVSFTWGPGRNFIISDRSVQFSDESQHNGVQWIGWDPTAKSIRSWTFEPDGGFGQGTWTQDGDTWTIQSDATLADGSKVTATTIITRTNADSLTAQIKNQTANGKPIPDGTPVELIRNNQP